jgi:hypothetical protein
MDPIATKGVELVAKSTIKALLSRLPTDADRVRATWEAMKEDIIVETAAALDRLVAAHGTLVEEVARKLDERAVTVLCVQLHEQAMKSATHERLRLMAAAIAGVFTPDFSLEMKSRAVRALAQLEPSDLILLRRGSFGDPNLCLEDVWSLQVSGCAFAEPIQEDAGASVLVLEVGKAVLRLVETWQGPAGMQTNG